MMSSDGFVALVYLKEQVRRWKTLTFFLLVALLILASRFLFGNSNINTSSDYVANIIIDGVITDDNYRTKILQEVASKENIKGLIVNIDSPGGDIVGSEILYENLRLISKNKPVVAIMGSVAASGGYMASVASDYIIARNGTITGSIGVILQSGEITELANKIGVNFVTYKSSNLKGSPSPFEKRNPQVDRVINDSIRDSYEFFVELVMDRRKDKLNKRDIDKVFDGRIFTGRQALKIGLIDEIGGKNEALVYLKKVLGLASDSELEVIDVEIKSSGSNLLETLFGKDLTSRFFGFSSNSKKLMTIWGS